MNTNTTRPKWWQVYLIFPLLIALFILDSRLKISVRGHQAVQVGIILLVYGLVHLWLKANAAALSNMDQQKLHGTVIVTRIPLQQLSKPKYDKRPMFQLSDHEVKNTLSDTFDMDYIDAEFLSVDEVPQKLNKE
jgi:hypothetical protein